MAAPEPKITPEKITKPIQLLAAWLAGLVLVNGSFLATAAALDPTDWLRIALVLASIANVPIFLGCQFLLQTKFRPEMQEDIYYAKYLESNTGRVVATNSAEAGVEKLRVELSASERRYIQLVSGLEANLKALVTDLSEKASSKGENPLRTPALANAAQGVARSAAAIEQAMEESVQASVSIQVNDLLPEYKRLRKVLARERLNISATFGSTSHEPEVPKRKIIAFGRDVPIELLRRIVELTKPFGFNEISYSKHSYNSNSIYIGSYIYQASQEPQPVPLEQVLGVLDSPGATFEDVIAEIELLRA